MAPKLHDLGILCEPDSREPWFVCEAHDQACLDETLKAFETAIDETLTELEDAKGVTAAVQAAG
jgi:glutamate-1-semialdehyde 2,1-aminomutase